ncbi:MAG: transglutaminase family protein [Candidatus Delongbacteria bacterium]|nr:transglutaminase family protein [Candidatus Delongbacteria bacterium]
MFKLFQRFIILIALWFLSQPLQAGRVSSIDRIIRFEHRQVNEDITPGNMEFYLAIPASNERQEILAFVPESGYREIVTDEYGNRVLHYIDQRVLPGEVVSHGWIAEVRLYAYLYDEPDSLQAAFRLTPEQQAIYLRDSDNYQLTDPIIRDHAQRHAETLTDPAAIIRHYFEFLIHHLTYVRDSIWDPAPQVISRRSGSCSEYNYAFLALCRAKGIPCRYTGGITVHHNEPAAYNPVVSEDAVFHRWSEVYLPGKAWYPVDCSRGGGELTRLGNPYHHYGRLPSGTLQTMRGDGTGQALLGWDYLSREIIGFKSSGKEAKVAYCLSQYTPGELEKKSRELESAIHTTPPRIDWSPWTSNPLNLELLLMVAHQLPTHRLPELVNALKSARHPEAIHWSILCQKRRLNMMFTLTYPFLCDQKLADQITSIIKGEQMELVEFEYWWRKARPLIRWDPTQERFSLTVDQIDRY